MNKKIMSFVLAMGLSVSLGVGNAFSAYDEYAQEFNKSYGNGNNSKTVMVGSVKSDNLVGNITTMFSYYAGTLISATSVGGSVTLYDSSGARFSATDVGNSWNLNSVTFKSSDFDVEEMNNRVNNVSLSDEDKNRIKRNVEAQVTSEVRFEAEQKITKEVTKTVTETIEKEFKKQDGESDDAFKARKSEAIEQKVKEANIKDKVNAEVKKQESEIAKEVEKRTAEAEKTKLKEKQDAEKAEWFNETLKSMGVNPQALKQIATDPDTGAILSATTYSNAETPKEYKWTDSEGVEHSKVFMQGDYKIADGSNDYLATHVSGEFIDKLVETLSSGVNMTASISFGDAFTGPTLSVSQNGKLMATYQSNSSTSGGLVPTSLYRYDDKGFVSGIETVSYNATKTSNGSMTLEATINYTKITYDSKGVRTDTSYKFNKFSSDPEKTLKTAKVGIAQKVEEKTVTDSDGNKKTEETNSLKDQLKEYDVLKVSETKYSANNSILSSIDYTTNNTTYYGGDGRPRYINNDQGATVGVYNYTSNGVMTSYFNAEGRDSNGNKVGTTTFFDQWGRQLFSAIGNKDLSDKKDVFMAEYQKGLKDGFSGTKYKFENGEAKQVEGSGTAITNIQVYADQVLDTNNQAIMTNGYIDMTKVNDYLEAKGSDVNDILNKNINLSKFGCKADSLKKALSYSNGPSTVLFQATIGTSGALSAKDLIEENKDELKDKLIDETTSTCPDANYSVSSYENVSYSGTVFYGGAAAFGTYANYTTNIEGAKKSKIGTDPVVEGTLFPEGASEQDIAAMAESLGIDANNEQAMNDLRNGFYTDTETGKTYAIVNASSINIMDGSGFQTAQGETVLVEVSAEAKSSIEAQIQNSDDRKIMFMGDVTEGVSKDSNGKGYLTMVMNTSYSGGVKQGTEAVQEAKNEIMLVSIGAAAANGSDISELQSKLESYNKINGTSFTMEKATMSYEKAKADKNNDNSWVVKNVNANMELFSNQTYDYRAGWDLLLGKAVLTTPSDENKTPALF
jgi:hypothetical protein